jgi:hypothetical protein
MREENEIGVFDEVPFEETAVIRQQILQSGVPGKKVIPVLDPRFVQPVEGVAVHPQPSRGAQEHSGGRCAGLGHSGHHQLLLDSARSAIAKP